MDNTYYELLGLYLPSTFSYKVNLSRTPEVMDYLGEEEQMTIDLTMSFLAYNYNQPVSIVLPPKAEEAIEGPSE